MPEWVLDNARRVSTYTKLKVDYVHTFMATQELVVALGGRMPTLVFHKGIVATQISNHGPTANGTVRDKPTRNTHAGVARLGCALSLSGHHSAYLLLVIVCFLMAWLAALEQAIIALRIKQTMLIYARQLELMVHIGGEHKVVAPLQKLDQLFIERCGARTIAVHHYLAAPVTPKKLGLREGIKPARVHIVEPKAFLKIREIALKALSRIRETSRR